MRYPCTITSTQNLLAIITELSTEVMRAWLGTYQEWVLFSDRWTTKFILEKLCSRPIRKNLCPWKFLAIWCWTFLKASNKHGCFVSHYTMFLQPVMFSILEDVTLHQLASILKRIFTLHSKLGCFVSSKIGNITLPSQVGHFVSSETRSTLSYFCLVHSHCKFLTFLYSTDPSLSTTHAVKVIFQHKHQSSSSKVHKFDATHYMYRCLPHSFCTLV